MSTTSPFTGLALPLLLGAAGTYLLVGLLKGSPIFSLDVRTSLVVLTIIGTAACTLGGIGLIANRADWLSPAAFVGYLAGAAILVVLGSLFFGYSLPFISSPSQAYLALAILMGAKIVVGTFYYLVKVLPR